MWVWMGIIFVGSVLGILISLAADAEDFFLLFVNLMLTVCLIAFVFGSIEVLRLAQVWPFVPQ